MFLRTNSTPASRPRALTPGVASYVLDTLNAANGVRPQQALAYAGDTCARRQGTVVSVYMTGEGLTTLAGVTGAITPAHGSGLKTLVAAVSATGGGVPADAEHAGWAPGMVAGIAQVNIRIPANAQSGSSVPIVISIEASSTQSGVTLAT